MCVSWMNGRLEHITSGDKGKELRRRAAAARRLGIQGLGLLLIRSAGLHLPSLSMSRASAIGIKAASRP